MEEKELLKAEIIKNLEEVTDIAMLQAIEAMLEVFVKRKKAGVIGYEIDGSLISEGELNEQVEEAVEEYEAGKGIPADEVHEKARDWLSSIK